MGVEGRGLGICDALRDLYNLKNVKNTHGEVLLLVKFQAILLHGCFSRFLNCTNGTKFEQDVSYNLKSRLLDLR